MALCVCGSEGGVCRTAWSLVEGCAAPARTPHLCMHNTRTHTHIHAKALLPALAPLRVCARQTSAAARRGIWEHAVASARLTACECE